MIKEIKHGGKLMAIVISHDHDEPGVNFFTPPEFSQQLAFIKHPAGTAIGAHIHNPPATHGSFVSEVLVVKKGKLRVDLYDESRAYVESVILAAGDVILLARGGHGFKIIEDIEIIEIRQGPHEPATHKFPFKSVSEDEIEFERSGDDTCQ